LAPSKQASREQAPKEGTLVRAAKAIGTEADKIASPTGAVPETPPAEESPTEGPRFPIVSRSDGALIREYVSFAGRVFGVSWKGPSLPDLPQLLGSNFAEFQNSLHAKLLGSHEVPPSSEARLE
jgi:hypothetical protein